MMNYQRAIAEIKKWNTKERSRQMCIIEEVINYDNQSSLEFENRLCREIFDRKDFYALSKGDRKKLEKMYYFCFWLQAETVSKTMKYLQKPRVMGR